MARYTTVNGATLRLPWTTDFLPLTDEVAPDSQEPVEPVPADALFAALDGSIVRRGRHERRVSVYSIFDEADSRWIQLKLHGRPEHLLTLRVSLDAPAGEIAFALNDWLGNPLAPHATVDATHGGYRLRTLPSVTPTVQ